MVRDSAAGTYSACSMAKTSASSGPTPLGKGQSFSSDMDCFEKSSLERGCSTASSNTFSRESMHSLKDVSSRSLSGHSFNAGHGFTRWSSLSTKGGGGDSAAAPAAAAAGAAAAGGGGSGGSGALPRWSIVMRHCRKLVRRLAHSSSGTDPAVSAPSPLKLTHQARPAPGGSERALTPAALLMRTCTAPELLLSGSTGSYTAKAPFAAAVAAAAATPLRLGSLLWQPSPPSPSSPPPAAAAHAAAVAGAAVAAACPPAEHHLLELLSAASHDLSLNDAWAQVIRPASPDTAGAAPNPPAAAHHTTPASTPQPCAPTPALGALLSTASPTAGSGTFRGRSLSDSGALGWASGPCSERLAEGIAMLAIAAAASPAPAWPCQPRVDSRGLSKLSAAYSGSLGAALGAGAAEPPYPPLMWIGAALDSPGGRPAAPSPRGLSGLRQSIEEPRARPPSPPRPRRRYGAAVRADGGGGGAAVGAGAAGAAGGAVSRRPHAGSFVSVAGSALDTSDLMQSGDWDCEPPQESQLLLAPTQQEEDRSVNLSQDGVTDGGQWSEVGGCSASLSASWPAGWQTPTDGSGIVATPLGQGLWRGAQHQHQQRDGLRPSGGGLWFCDLE